MVIDPNERVVSDIYQLTNSTLSLQEIRKVEEAAHDNKWVEAIGPKEHLEALRRDLLKAGYRKAT